MGFREDVKRFVEKTKVNESLLVRYVVLKLAADVIQRSPVKTGRFRGNWMLGSGSPNTNTVEILDPSGEQSSARFAQGEYSVGGIYYITNSLPYARPLEYGHSQQAPQGMVRLAVMNMERYVREAVEQLK